ncbi:Cleavage stimulation factor subunit [Lachnellula subtilissima]|uniref:Cleavage stimulation factor subunit n=1 Tax=Lachnellula subtilissima TaxID=602034 RepID=A0A8H8S111_9HELO|nr:Cleavage stimulation factor subunit [Lachnellula subtilissima]
MSTMSTKPPSKSVFVGNIPYGLTEEQIVDIFSSAGKVLNFRLVYDRETGRPKGFGFAEYPDSDSASSAVRNLNDYEIMNRKLRVDFSNDAGGDDDNSAPAGYQHPPPSNGMPIPPPSQAHNGNSTLPPLPLGIDLPAGLDCPDAISRTLSTLPPQQLLDVLSQMKTLATTDPSKATELLHQAPQLSYAIFQALLLMGLVSTDALTSVVEQATNTVPTGAYPPGFPPPPQHMSGQLGVGTPPVPNHGYAPPPPPPPPQAVMPDQEALIAQVMAMSQEVVDSLPAAERQQIMALRATYGR